MGASPSPSAATGVTLFPTAIRACALANRVGETVAVQLPERFDEATLVPLRALAEVGRPRQAP